MPTEQHSTRPCTRTHLGVDHKALGNVLQGVEDDVCGEEGLGHVDAADGAVVQSALKPLHGVRVLRIRDLKSLV